MGWTSCFMKQRVNCCRWLCRLVRSDSSRKCHKIWRWTSRRRKGWNFEVLKVIERLNVRDLVYNETWSTKCAMRTIIEKLSEQDNSELYAELFNDRRNMLKRSKLRKYRQYKCCVKAEPYVKINISRMERRTMALFRAGSLPLAIKTGRYSKSPIPINERLC